MGISNTNGAWLTVVGEADIGITFDKYIHETTAPVSSDVQYNLLVACHDLQFINDWEWTPFCRTSCEC